MTLDLKTWATERHRIATDVVAFTDGMTEESVHERATNQFQSSIPLRAAGHSQGGGIHDEVGEPQAHGAFFTKDTLEGWLHRSKIEKRLIHIEHDQRKTGHVFRLLCVVASVSS